MLGYPGCHPDINAFLGLELSLHEIGRVIPMAHMNVGCPWTVRALTIDDVNAAVGQEPWRISCDILQELRLSRLMAHELHNDQLHPYHY
jgi:hypothetical protein